MFPVIGEMCLLGMLLIILIMSKVVIGAVPINIKQIICDYISNLKCWNPEQSLNLWCPHIPVLGGKKIKSDHMTSFHC